VSYSAWRIDGKVIVCQQELSWIRKTKTQRWERLAFKFRPGLISGFLSFDPGVTPLARNFEFLAQLHQIFAEIF
jgi:hypothetical protein